MKERIFDGRLAERIAGDDSARTERLKAVARTLVGVVRDGLVRDGIVRVHGFGTFQLRQTRAHAGINPATGERIRVPARHRVVFRPAKALRERVDPDPGRAMPLNEPQPSREALLAGGVSASAAAAGGVPRGVQPSPVAERAAVAAAAMPDTTLRSTRDPEARAVDRAGEAPPTSRPDEPVVNPVAAAEPVAAGPSDVGGAANTGDPGEPEPQRRRRGLALLALVAVIGLLVWLLWPTSLPLHEGEDGAIVRTDDAVTPPEEAGAGGAEVPTEPAELAAGAAESAESESTGVADDPPAGPAALDEGGSMGVAPGIAAVPADIGAAALDPALPATIDERIAALGTHADVPEASTDVVDPPVATASPGDPAAPMDTVGFAPLAEVVAGLGGDIDVPTAASVSGKAALERSPDTGAADAAMVDPVGAPTDPAANASGDAWFAARDYAVARGDTLWGLATRYYVDPFYWPHIYNHNHAELPNPDRLAINQQLLLPAMQGGPTDLTAADRTSIAEGYLRLYRFWVERGEANADYALIAVRVFDADVLPDALAASGAGYASDTMGAVYQAELTRRFGE